jgi:hypothetical protein
MASSPQEVQISSHEPNRFEFQTHPVLECYCAAQSIDLKETPSLKQADPVQPLLRQQKSSFLQIGVLPLCQWTCFKMYSLLVRVLQKHNFMNSQFAIRVKQSAFTTVDNKDSITIPCFMLLVLMVSP